MPSSQLYAVMNFMRVSLAVQCNFCHVRTPDGKWNWESDEKQEKQTTRRMIRMVLDINKGSFNGRTTVSCYTCHRNQRDPINVPPASAPPPPNQTASAEAKPRETLPTAEQILTKYAAAIGGSEAVEKLKTRWAKGTLTAQGLSVAPFEIYQQAPNKYLFILTTPNGKIEQGFDGSRAWSGDAKGAQAASGEMLAQIKRNADFYHDLKLKEQFQRIRVVGKEKIGEHETYVVIGRTTDNRNERLFFDVDSGLLLRRIAYTPTLIGQVPEITDYEDYREVQGVKIAFVKRRAQLDNFEAATFKLDEVRFNAPVDADKFNPPAATK
jgi:outer membrane lipoprotein-sorting protein